MRWKWILLLFPFVFVNGIFALQKLSITPIDGKIDGSTFYYIGDNPRANITVIPTEDNNITIYINNDIIYQGNETFSKVVSLPTTEFSIIIKENNDTVYNKTFEPRKLAVQDLIISIISKNLMEKEEVKFKVTVMNDNIPEDSINLVVKVYKDGSIVKDYSFNFPLDEQASITRYMSFIPDEAGEYTITAQVYSKGLKIREASRTILVEVSKPNIILSTQQNQYTIPSDVVTQVIIQNRNVHRKYRVTLEVISPFGEYIFRQTKEVEAPENVNVPVFFTFPLENDYPEGIYTIVAKVSFKARDKEITLYSSTEIKALGTAPSVLVDVRVPKEIENGKKLILLLNLEHQSVRAYQYYYQC